MNRYETLCVIPTSGLDEVRQIKTIYTTLILLYDIIILQRLWNVRKIKNLYNTVTTILSLQLLYYNINILCS